MVYATRRERRGETWLKRTTAAMFYRVIGNLGETEIRNRPLSTHCGQT